MNTQEIMQKIIMEVRDKSLLVTINAVEYVRLRIKGLNPLPHLEDEEEIVKVIESHLEGLTNEEKEEVLFSLYLNLITSAQKILMQQFEAG
jgi:hypothetical protein